MPSCVAYGCVNRTSKNVQGLTFHRFPVDATVKKRWIQAVRRKDWEPTSASRLCSVHFEPHVIDRSMKQVRLKENAVPTIFPAFPEHLKPHASPRSPPKPRSSTLSVAEQSPSQEIVPCSPTKESLKRTLEESSKTQEKLLKKIKLLHQSKRRLKKKVSDLNDVISGIKKRNLMAEDSLEILGAVSKQNKQLLVRQLAKATGKCVPNKYPPELRTFALTLNFYSPAAYKYVRNSFSTCLPHPRTISKWYRHVNGSPGFSAEALDAVKNKVEESSTLLLFSLIIDEMAIRQHVEFDGKMFHGYASVGKNIDDDSMPLAKEVLVFLLVCINQTWKIPVGYFLVEGLNSTQRSNLVNQCLFLLDSAKATIISLTFDGLPSNFVMARELGCNLEPTALNTRFSHPVSGESIVVYLDPSHMLKLVRNTLGEKKSLTDGSNNIVHWKYLEELHKLQKTEGLHLGNKLRASHIAFFKKKMKVSFAAQLLSRSVADAIEFCNVEMQLPQFQGSEATVKFIRIFNSLFDVLNSRSLKQFEWKKALCTENLEKTMKFLSEIETYILHLKDTVTGTALVESNRKTGFLGFLICIESVKSISQTLFSKPDFSCLPTYRMSQDHLELFFAAIRRHGGCNNNPTARQFASAYKKMLLKTELGVTSGNCLPLCYIPILSVNSALIPEDIINGTSEVDVSDYDTIQTEMPPDHDYIFCAGTLSIVSEHVVYYIAGFVVRKLSLKLKCEQCVAALYDECQECRQQNKTLVCYKSDGCLIYPSQDVFVICKKSEAQFRHYSNTNGDTNLSKYSLLKCINCVLMQVVDMTIFSSLNSHAHDTYVLDNHIVQLSKAIIKQYLTTRFSYFAKSAVDNSKSVRQQYTKMILFKGQ